MFFSAKDEMEQTVGARWNTEHTYLNYLINQMTLGDYPLLDDSLHMLVFLKGEEVVLDITLDRFLAGRIN